ncbi:MAG TPA: helix-turn-helix domain-containing GNAT family N-acetyltransferase [Gemmatimonadales bacterium]|nr:helix-turn-helix domain-containing GNAT family N-acetyltransferase [Gemmatimonadales bacterium]
MSASPNSRVDAIRRFNRFYTRRIGVLNQGLLDSPFSLAEVRLLYELANRESSTPTELGKALEIDAGYLSRLLQGLERRGLIARLASRTDGRQRCLRLTPKGRRAFASLDAEANRQVETWLRDLSAPSQAKLVEALETVRRQLDPALEQSSPKPGIIMLREPRAGDMGWVVHRHGVLYAQEYGWDWRFEALVSRIVADFVEQFDPARERCWIAEGDQGEILGSVFLVKYPERSDTAKLRLLLVEPSARGRGIGRRLVAECTRFATQAGYQRITLWTNDVLHAARHLYEEAGYQLVHEEPHQLFGEGLVGQTWELKLPSAVSRQPSADPLAATVASVDSRAG